MSNNLETFELLNEYVQETFEAELINPGRNKQIIISMSKENFNEEAIYELLPDWNGKYSEDEEKISYEGEVLIYTNLMIDTTDNESLIPFDITEMDEDLDEEENDDEDYLEEDWLITGENDSNSWLDDIDEEEDV